MQLHPVVSQANGIVSVYVQATFVGDSTDVTDKQRILAYGDPKVNLGGSFTDPANTDFTFAFPASELFAGVTTQMQSYVARFMTTPQTPPCNSNPQFFPYRDTCNPDQTQGKLDCITSNPVEAATVWASAIQTRVATAMTALRAETPASLSSLPNQTV